MNYYKTLWSPPQSPQSKIIKSHRANLPLFTCRTYWGKLWLAYSRNIWYPWRDGLVWAGLESGFGLPCPRGKNIQISFYILMTIKSEIIQKLSLKVNDIPITLQYQNDFQGAFVFTGKLPANAISGPFLRLVFSVPYTITPCDITLDNKDSRLLGFLLNWLKLEAQ